METDAGENMTELLKSELEDFRREYFHRNSQAEESRQREHRAATHIQSWFRACKVRLYLSYLHKKAVIIQKIWRGFTARARFRQMLKAAYFIMKMNFYEEMAVRIQRRWRGFFVRKYIHNFYARKRYLEGLYWKNELVRRELHELEGLQKRERETLDMVKEQRAKVYQAHRFHHLLSTKQCPGIFNSPFRTAPHEMEQLLKQVKYQAPTRLDPREGAYALGMPGPTPPSLPRSPGSSGIKTTSTSYSSRIRLPPITSRKQQDLFREPGEVWQQRVRCPDLTLGLQTSYAQLEEAQSRLRQHESVRLYGGTAWEQDLDTEEPDVCSTSRATAAMPPLAGSTPGASDSRLYPDSKRSRSRQQSTPTTTLMSVFSKTSSLWDKPPSGLKI